MDCSDDSLPLPHVPGGAKLRLMCSYGGHIMPRPHHKSLSYIGGDTRIVAIDRHSSLNDLSSRLSRTLLHGRPFTLKYHLPNEDLDNLITVATDEDLQIMFQEHDRLATSTNPSPFRLRLFLFFNRPQTALSMGPLLDDINSDTCFLDALNNSAILSRVVSDSAAAVDCLLNLDSATAAAGSNNNNLEGDNGGNKAGSPVVDNLSSFGSASSSSSSSMANLPPITVQQEETLQLHDVYAAAPVVTNADNVNRKPPLPLQIVQPRTTSAYNLPSPDSVASDSSIASANSFSKIVYFQEQVQAAHVDNKVAAPALPNSKSTEISDHSTAGLQVEPIQNPSYTSPQQQLDQNQQQFVYIHHPHPSGTPQVPVPSYYPVYAQPPTQQHYPVYVMPVGTSQHYNMTLQQPNLSDPNNIAASIRPNPPIIYPTNKSDVAVAPPSVYKAPVASNPAFVQIPPNCNQFQQQYVGLPQHVHHPSQPVAIAPTPPTTSYGYEYGDQVYYTQQQQATSAPQYQSMTPAAAAAALSDASKQFPIDNIQQPSRTQQPV